MKAKLTLLGISNRPIPGLPLFRGVYSYFAEWENGAVDIVENEDYLVTEEGDYITGICDIPFEEEAIDGEHLLGRSVTRQDGPGKKRKICTYSAFLWT